MSPQLVFYPRFGPTLLGASRARFTILIIGSGALRAPVIRVRAHAYNGARSAHYTTLQLKFLEVEI